MAEPSRSFVLGWVAALAIPTLLGCASTRASRPPNHEELVNHHMVGRYDEVLRWCPPILDDRGAEPALSDWCLFGYPAALRLALHSDEALAFMRTACLDLGGQPVGDEEFRLFYVREVVRWYALPLRLQKQDKALARAMQDLVDEYAEVCRVDPAQVYVGLDTAL